MSPKYQCGCAPNPGGARQLGLSGALNADWHRSPTQRSAPQNLVQGRRYYLEVWHEGSSIRSLALGWNFPGEPPGTPPRMVDLQALSPLIETSGQSTPP